MMTLTKRWTLCQQIVNDFWKRWSREHLQQLQAANKWHHSAPNLQVGDLVLMKDSHQFQTNWGLARVTATFPGADGLVRAVEVLTKKVAVPDSRQKRPLTLDQFQVKASSLRRPVHKLALLIPAKSIMKNPTESLHGGEDVGAMQENRQDGR